MCKKPDWATLLSCSLVSLLTLASIGCTSAAKRTAEEAEQARIQHALDYGAIQNVMARHAYYSAAGEHQRELNELWAMTTQGVSWGTDDGFWVDARELTEYYVKYFDTVRAKELAAFSKAHPEVTNVAANFGAGTSMFQTLSTPVLEIAGDGYTAKGVWYSVGQVTQTPDGKQAPMYVWERYAVDFYKPNKDWKIWHFFVHRDWSAAPGQSWVRGPGSPPDPGMALPADAPLPSVRLTRDPKASPFAPPSEILKLPQPYQNFSLTFSYGPPNDR